MTRKDPAPKSGARTARKRTTTPRKPTTAKDPEAPPRRSPAGRSARQTVPPPPPPPGDAGWRYGLGSLLRGSGGVLGQISGIDGPARSLERLAYAADKAAAMLDKVDAEIGIERILDVIDHIERLTVASEELRDLLRDTRRSIREVEERVVDLHTRVLQPLDRLPLTRRRRRRKDDPEAGRL